MSAGDTSRLNGADELVKQGIIETTNSADDTQSNDDDMAQKKVKRVFNAPSFSPIYFDVNKIVQSTAFDIGIKPIKLFKKTKKR